MTKKVSVNFRSDPMFPRIERIVAEQLAKGNVVAPVGVLIGMGLLRPEHLADWRRGRVAYLEHVINCNLSRLSRLLRILRFHAHDLNLKPSLTVYKRSRAGGSSYASARLATPTSKPPTLPTLSDRASDLCLWETSKARVWQNHTDLQNSPMAVHEG
jgi:hypothetical protein